MTTWSRRRWVAIVAAAVVVAAATTITVVVANRNHPPAAAISDCPTCPGYTTCATDPDNCNAGDRLPDGDIVVAVEKTPRAWNPWSVRGNAGDTGEEVTPLLPSAYTFMPSGRVLYNADLLASEPQVVSLDPVRIVYRLSPAAVWNDGTGRTHPVSAQDFVFAWRALSSHDKNLPRWPTPGYDRIARVVGSDGGRTVTVTLRAPYAAWKGLFTRLEPYWFAAAASGADPDHASRMTDAQLETAFAALDAAPSFSAGPYMIRSVEPDGSTVEVPNPRWYGQDKPTLRTITFRHTDSQQNVALLRDGKIDMFTGIPDGDTVQALANTQNVGYNVLAGFGWEQLLFNFSDSFLRDGALRAAVMDAINVQEIIDRTVKPFFPDAIPVYSHNLQPGQAGYQPLTQQVDPVQGSGNLDAAKKLLSAAGYTGVGRAGSLRTPDGRVVTIALVHTDTAVRDGSAELIRDDVARLGITVTDRPTGDLTGALGRHAFGIAEFGLLNSPLLDGAADLWGSHGAANFTGWGDPGSDALLAQAATTLDSTQAAELLNQQDKILTLAHVSLPLYSKPQLIAYNPRYINLRANSAGYVTYNTQQWGLLKPAE